MADEARAPASAQVQRPTAKPESSGAKVTVYCSIPTGLDLRVFKMVRQVEQMFGGGTREFEIAEQVGGAVHCNGNRFRLGEESTHRVVFGFGVTEGVPKDVWDAWLKDNKGQPYVVNGLIFAAERPENGEAEAKDRRDTWTGLGPMAKDGDPRSPRPGANMRQLKQYDKEDA